MSQRRSTVLQAFSVGLLCLLLPTLAFAEPIAWTGGAGDGSWHTPGNWDLNRVPTQADDVTIGLDGTYTVSVSSNVIARTLTLGGSTGTQTLALNSDRFDLRISGTVLPQGVLQLTNPSALWVLTADNSTLGTLVNSGTIRAGADGSAGGQRTLVCHLNNQGTVIAYNAQITMGAGTSNVINSGTISALGGNFSCTFDGEFRNFMNVTNTGTITVSPGRTFRTRGTVTLQGGTFGGSGGSLHLGGSIINLSDGDFLTSNWTSVSVGYSTFNGPGRVINNGTASFDPDHVIFNAPVENQASLDSYGCNFPGGLTTSPASTLRIRSTPDAAQTTIATPFTNSGTLVLVEPTTTNIYGPGPTLGTLVNTGTIQAGADGSPGGRRILNCNLTNQGVAVAYNAGLTMGAAVSNVINSGTIQASGGDFSCSYDGEFRNFMNVTNTGTIAISPGRTFRTRGTITLQGGTIGGPGANLHLTGSTINLAAGDFLTSDWASLDVGYSTFNGPGRVINDRLAGFDPLSVTFNALVDNRTVLSTPGAADAFTQRCSFNAGLLNQTGATLRILGDNNLTYTSITGGFTNDGTVHIIGTGAFLQVTGGPLVNNGLIEARREGRPQGTRGIIANIDNHGTITNLDVSDLRIGQGNQTLTLNNSGTINIETGVLSNHDGVNATNFLTFNNTGAVNLAPGTLYRQRAGTLNLISGTFGGPGSHLNLIDATVVHPADFHTADWASIYDNGAIFNGPGTFVNDHPVGFTALANTGTQPIFNTFVRNVTTFNAHAARFTSGYINKPGSTLSIRYTANATPFSVTHFYSSFTNDGVLEVVDPGAALLILSPTPPQAFGTITNGATGQIHIRHLETPAAGLRFLSCNIANHGRVTVHDVDLQVGGGNQSTSIVNYGTFDLRGGDLVFQDAPFNKASITNFGVFDLGVDHTVNQAQQYYTNIPPLVFENKRGAILSGSGTIYCANGGATLDNRIEAGGIIRPGGENAVGTLSLFGEVTVPETAFQIGLIVEVDVGGPGPQANDQLNATLLSPQGGRYLSVNILGPNLPPAGTGFSVGAFPYIATNLPVTNGTVCVDCGGFGGPGTACDGPLTVVGAGCPGPTITQQPQSLSPCSGDTVSFSVAATGAEPLSYQWQKVDLGVATLANGPTAGGSTITGANGPTLTITNLAAADLGSYAVAVFDANGSRISSLATLIGGCVVINVTEATEQSFLDSLTTPNATIVMQNVPDRPTLTLSALTNLGGTMQVTGNGGLTTLTANLLTTVGGRVDVRNNPLLTGVALPALATVTGDVDVSNNSSAIGIDLSGLSNASGSVSVSNNDAAIGIDLSGLSNAGGSVSVSNNGAATGIDLSSLSNAGASVNITNNPGATVVQLNSLQTVVGSVSIRDNLALAAVSLPLLTDVDGGIDVSGNTSATTIDLSQLGGVSGSITVSDNPSAAVIDLSQVGGVSGSITVSDNPGATTIALDSLTDVGGDLTLETQGQTDVDLSNAAVAGNTDINSVDATSVAVQTPGGTASIEMCNGAVCMDADLPDNATPDGTPFAVLHVSGSALDPQAGLDASGAPTTVDPVAAYTFTLGAPLQGPASLVFELTLAALSPAEQTAVLGAYAAGNLTLTVQGDNPGDLPTARAQCGPSDPLVPDGCVRIGAFDGLGFQLPPGETAGAEKLRLAALVSHFSTYGIAIVSGLTCPADFNADGELNPDDLADYIGAYFAQPPGQGSDFNNDGETNPDDLADFIGAYFAGC